MHVSVTRKSGLPAASAFSVIESLVVIVVMLALFFVLGPSLAYKMGWLTPPPRDMDVEIRDVRHPSSILRSTGQIKVDATAQPAPPTAKDSKP